MSRHRQDEWEAREAALVEAADAAKAAQAAATFSGPDTRWFVWRARKVVDRFVIDMSKVAALVWSSIGPDEVEAEDECFLHVRYSVGNYVGVWPDSEGVRAFYAAFLRYVGVDP